MKKHLMFIALAAGISAFAANDAAARSAFQVQQAVQGVDRLSQQFDVLSANVDRLGTRVANIENGGGNDVQSMKDEIAGLKAQIEELRRAQAGMRQEIVTELSAKMAALMARQAPAPSPKSTKTTAKPAQPVGNYYDFVVEQGQTLSDIARAYKTSVKRIIEANNLKNANSLKVGQKLVIPVD